MRIIQNDRGSIARPAGFRAQARGSGAFSFGDLLVVPELRARLALLDGEDKLVGYVGENEAVCDIAGWRCCTGSTGEGAG